MKTDIFQSCGHCWVCQICWHNDCSALTASSFRIWNSSTWIPSPPLALFIVMLPKAQLTSNPKMSDSRWSGDIFCGVLLCIFFNVSFIHLFTNKEIIVLRKVSDKLLCNLILFIFLFFNWWIIALQNSVVFCYTSARISHKYTYVPSLPHLPPISLPTSPFSLSQSPCLSSLSHTENSHWLSVLHKVL